MENKKNIIIGILIFLLLCAVGLCIYLVVDKSNNVSDNETEQTENKVEELDINGHLVKKLYDNINGENGGFAIEVKDGEKVLAENVSAEAKNYLAYRQLNVEKLNKNGSCIDYKNRIQKNFQKQSGLLYGCGSGFAGMTVNSFDNVSTYYIEEKDLKETVEIIFGENSYERADFTIDHCSAQSYMYDESTSHYFYGSAPIGCTGLGYPEFYIVSAKKINDSIEIIQNAKIEVASMDTTKLNKYDINVKYTFISKDGTYYFYSAEKVN